jgi:hypothetical protein
MSEASYEVGYGKPPAGSRFTKGRSGNPKGRPKGSVNFNTTLEKVLRETIRATENGRPRTMPKSEAIARQLTNKALTGDLKAIKETITLQQAPDETPDPNAPDSPDDVRNRAVLALLKQRLKQIQDVSTPTDLSDGDDE